MTLFLLSRERWFQAVGVSFRFSEVGISQCTGIWTGLQNFDRFFWNVWNSIVFTPVKVPVDFLIIWFK